MAKLNSTDIYGTLDVQGKVVAEDDVVVDGSLNIGTSTNLTTGGSAKVSIITNEPSSNVGLSIGDSNSNMMYFRHDGEGLFNFQTYNSSGNSGSLNLQPYGGNVGIGTTSPNDLLHLKGDTYKHLVLDRTENASVDTLFTVGASYSGSNQYLRLGTTSSEIMNLRSDGNVGIGTSSPSAKLDVSANSDATGIWLRHPNNNELVLRIDSYGTTGTDAGSLFRMYDQTTSAERIRIDARQGSSRHMWFNPGGNIGLGTDNPTSKLHINGDTRIEGDLTVNGTYTQIDTNTSTTEQWIVTNDGTGPAVVINQTGAQPVLDVQDDGVSALYIEDGGNVGIGTTNPNTKLTVAGTIESLAVSSTEGGDLRLRAATGNAYQFTIDNYSDSLRFVRQNDSTGSSGVVQMMLQGTTGNVGIGTITPNAKLQVVETLSVVSSGDIDEPDLEGILMRVTDTNNNNASSDLFFVENNNLNYGARFNYDGSTNEFYLYMHNNSATGTEVLKFDRNTTNVYMSGNLYLNRDNSPTDTDTFIYFGDDESDTAHYISFDDSEQKFNFTNSLEVTGNIGTTGYVYSRSNVYAFGDLYLNYNGSDATDTHIYFGDGESITAHYIQFDDSSQKFNFSNDILVNGSSVSNGALTSVKDWTGILTTTNGTSVPVTEDLNGALIAVEFWTANTADYPRVLQYGRMDTNGNLKFLFTNINTYSATATLYLNIFGLEYTSSSALEMILPTATYLSTGIGSPSTPSATTSQDTIYLVDIYKVTEA